MKNGDLEDAALPIQKSRSKRVRVGKKLATFNKLTVQQKLSYSMDMMEAVANLHNYPGGVIVHDDIQLGQFLVSDDGQHLKLQDFNRAEILLWNEKKEEYCVYKNGRGHGDVSRVRRCFVGAPRRATSDFVHSFTKWRSPEEYKDKPLTEMIDMWSLGNNMYSVLTGLNPFYKTDDSGDVRKKVKTGETAYIDPRYQNRSLAEAKIAEAIKWCWMYDPEDRKDPYTILQLLREAEEDTFGHKRASR